MQSYKQLYRWIIFLLIPPIAACGGKSDGGVEFESGNSPGIAIPKAVRTATIDADGITYAILYCDGNDHAMTIANDIATGTCSDLSTETQHTITIEFRFTPTSSPNQSYPLATATKENVSVTSGNTSLSFQEADYDTSFDSDGDQISNVDEVRNNTDPGDSGCVLGHSFIGHCTL